LIAKVKPRFIEPMLLLRTEMLPEGPEWGYEIKLDGYPTPYEFSLCR
jgi:ATP-dependent DNA ligase